MGGINESFNQKRLCKWSDEMKLIIGLGNPGKEYDNTRHNIGFFMIDQYLDSKGINQYKTKFNGLYVDLVIHGEKVIFLKPQSYMNLSGEVVRRFVDFYKISIDDILVISDDLDLNIGNFKLKEKGSSGGHNGLKNIELHLGTQNYKRIKIGIANNKNVDTKDYVLGKFQAEDMNLYQDLSKTINHILDEYFLQSFDLLISKYNKKNR